MLKSLKLREKILLILSLVVSLMILTSEGNAQNNVEFGIRGGVNFTNISDENFNATTQTGFTGGIYSRFSLGDNSISIQPEVLYTQKGFKFDDKTYRIDYVEVPLLARVDLNTNDNLVPNIYFGPYIGFKLNTELPRPVVYYDYAPRYDVIPEPCYYCTPPSPFQSGFYEGDINNTDLGIIVGGSLDFGLINLGVRYQAGLTKISDDKEVSARHSVFSILTGIGF